MILIGGITVDSNLAATHLCTLMHARIGKH